MEHLDPIETARRILAGESLVENNIVEDEVDEIVVEDFEDLDIEEVEEMAHGNKKKMKKKRMTRMTTTMMMSKKPCILWVRTVRRS